MVALTENRKNAELSESNIDKKAFKYALRDLELMKKGVKDIIRSIIQKLGKSFRIFRLGKH